MLDNSGGYGSSLFAGGNKFADHQQCPTQNMVRYAAISASLPPPTMQAVADQLLQGKRPTRTGFEHAFPETQESRHRLNDVLKYFVTVGSITSQQ